MDPENGYVCVKTMDFGFFEVTVNPQTVEYTSNERKRNALYNCCLAVFIFYQYISYISYTHTYFRFYILDTRLHITIIILAYFLTTS